MIEAFTTAWGQVLTFFISIFAKLQEIFWVPAVTEPEPVPGHLTFIGIMAIIMAGVALILLVFNLIRSFFAMRG